MGRPSCPRSGRGRGMGRDETGASSTTRASRLPAPGAPGRRHCVATTSRHPQPRTALPSIICWPCRHSTRITQTTGQIRHRAHLLGPARSRTSGPVGQLERSRQGQDNEVGADLIDNWSNLFQVSDRDPSEWQRAVFSSRAPFQAPGGCCTTLASPTMGSWNCNESSTSRSTAESDLLRNQHQPAA